MVFTTIQLISNRTFELSQTMLQLHLSLPEQQWLPAWHPPAVQLNLASPWKHDKTMQVDKFSPAMNVPSQWQTYWEWERRRSILCSKLEFQILTEKNSLH